MQIATGTVMNGKINIEGVPLIEGDTVAVVMPDTDKSFSLTATDELLNAIAEINQQWAEKAKQGLANLKQNPIRKIAPPGAMQGKIHLADDFDAPLDDMFDCFKQEHSL